jgi:hypothetical protein
MDVILAGHATWGVVDVLPDHVHVVDVDPEPWTPFEPGWETAEDDGPPMSEPAQDALSNVDLLSDAMREALAAHAEGLVLGGPVFGNTRVLDAYADAHQLAVFADTGRFAFHAPRRVLLAENAPATEVTGVAA